MKSVKRFPIFIAIGLVFLLFFSGGKIFSKTAKTNLPTLNSNALISPNLIGPEFLCFSYGGKSVIGVFSGEGEPDLDVYTWKIFAPDGSLISTFTGGGLLQNINYTFSLPGVHKVELEVKRGVMVFPAQILNVRVQDRPQTTLNPRYSLCGDDPLVLEAISSSTPFFSDYVIEWKNQAGVVIGSQNKIEISQPGNYSATIVITSSNGIQECSTVLTTQVDDSNNVILKSNRNSLCSDQSIQFETNPSSNGKWFVKKVGSSNEKVLNNNAPGITISPSNLTDGYGSYDVIYEVINPDAVNCLVRKSQIITYNPQPDFILLEPIPSSGCEIADGGIVVQALTAIDYIYIKDSKISTPPLSPGQTYTITGVASGAYNLISVLGECINTYASVVPLGNPPPELEFNLGTINGETCTTDGRLNGDFLIDLINGPVDGIYRVLDEKGGTILGETFTNKSELLISVPGGKYVFELYNLDSCSLPKEELIEIPGKFLVDYSIPGDLLVCQSSEITPQSIHNLEYELISPSGKSDFKNSNEPFIITEQGEHKIIGRNPVDDDFCPVSKLFEVTLVNPVDFDIVLIQEDCLGNRIYKADLMGKDTTSVLFKWYNEKDEVVGTSQFLNPISTGEFKLEVQPSNSSSCPIPPKSFLISEPILRMDVSLSATQLCEVGPKAIITAVLEYPDEATDIEWRRFDENGAIEELPQFDNQTEIEVDQGGTYESAVYSIKPEIGKNCDLGRKSIVILLNTDRVDFTVPSEISFCEETSITPEFGQALVFEVLAPDGTTATFNSGSSFTLNQSGDYEVYAYDTNPNPTLCPDIQVIQATRNEKIIFEPKFLNQSCMGEITYTAEIGAIDLNDITFQWTNSVGDIVGTDQTFTTLIPGTYYLNVQPAGGMPCEQTPISFEVLSPVLAIDVALLADALCPGSPSAAVRINADLSDVTTIEWWFASPTGEQSQLVGLQNKKEILVINEGTYEARLFNKTSCLLGSDKVLILRSTDDNRPQVNKSYQICTKYDIGPTINPGSFARYEWYYGDQLLSTNPVYKPEFLGSYQLTVYSQEGCAYQVDFSAEQECDLKVMYPNAVQPGNPTKEFLLYTNYLIDEVNLAILNKWGQVVFECSQTNLISEESTCAWNGLYNGKAIPNGNYAVRVNFKNRERNISKTEFGSILIIE
ncbi:gliding motility-associated C-terminal domain-containing protein [Algoriphagus ratkowskyi]|uniref:gliding motility-associated C-terminal domain-containing protein n=1 Tax=Algoriphagus ratkowskyi TaxID=57028 RepID=UPI001302731D|nr:gliding motility-associated C-terminal domain-containing protein [Algoriphagus ratkowskyi]